MRGRRVPSDFLFVFDNKPFYRRDGGKVYIGYASDRWRFEGPFAGG